VFKLSVFILLFFPAASGCLAEEGAAGPIEITNQYPFSALHLSWSPGSAEVSEPGSTRLKSYLAWSNTAIIEDRYTLDAESRELRTSLLHSFGQGLELGMDLPLLWRGGGVLDPAIDAWHRMLGMPRGDRPRMEHGDFELDWRGENPGSLRDAGLALGNLVLRAKYQLIPAADEQPALAFESRLSLPTAAGDFGHDGLDVLNGLLGSDCLGNYCMYAGLAHIYFLRSSVNGLDFHHNHAEGFSVLEYRGFKSFSLLGGLYAASAVVDILGHTSYSLYLDIGMRLPLSRTSSFELLLRENPSAGRGSADVSFLSGVVFDLL